MDIIIIGAGAAGLMAANKLTAAGLKVIILEARDRIGGRIYTVNKANEPKHEAGAEFVHGKLPVTLKVMQEASIKKHIINGDFWNVTDGKWSNESDFFKHIDTVIERLKEIKEDISIAAFLNKNFSDEKYEKLRKSLKEYIEGYYAGSIERTSSKAFLEELTSEQDEQYRPVGGYGNMIQHLADSSGKAGAVIQLSTVVKEVRWHKGSVEVIDTTGKVYSADKVIITVPLGVWTSESNTHGAIKYTPSINEKHEAAKQMGFGSAIKILINFKSIFWTEKTITEKLKVDLSKMQFAITDMAVRTWWTQYPDQSTMLTGWIAGPPAEGLKDAEDEQILYAALTSLKGIFDIDIPVIQENIQWWKVYNWSKDPFSCGAYSYSTTETANARKVLSDPIEDTLFFAGEALYNGPETGTVEAALISGEMVAERVIKMKG